MIDGLIPITDEQAKLGQEIVKAFRELGSFFGKALGSTPEDLIGYFGGDRLRIRRAENIVRMMYQAKERLLEWGVEQTRPATLRIALPLLEGAADEDREELVDLWARLLANAMDPNMNNVRQSFIEAVKRMDPLDAVVFRYIYETRADRVSFDEILEQTLPQTIACESISEVINRRCDEVEVSIRHLQDLSFFDEHRWFEDDADDGQKTQRLSLSVNAAGREFLRACYPELGRVNAPE